MFFSLERSANTRFSCSWTLGDLVLNTDSGWRRQQIGEREYVYKGYMDATPISTAVANRMIENRSGNYAVFEYYNGVITLHNNRGRGFMIWAGNDSVSNLIQSDYPIWNDQELVIGQELNVVHGPKNIVGTIDTEPMSFDRALTRIDTILNDRIATAIKQFDRPIKVFLSGGIDSMLVFSYIKKFTSNYELVFENRVQWDYFWCQNHRTIQDQFWGYKQIHHWREPCMLSSGTPGDEYMLRSPTTANLYLMYHGTDMLELLEDPEFANCHHIKYFDKHRDTFTKQLEDVTLLDELDKSREDFFWYLCNIIANDCQHWHLGDTLTFTPLRDIEIFKTLLRMDLDSAKKQIMNSELSRQLIARNDPDLLNYISDYKNSGNSFANLVPLMHKHSTNSLQ